MTVPKKETLAQIFVRLYDNDNKICTRRSLFEQFKEVNREWLKQTEWHLTKADAYSRDHLNGKKDMCKELVEECK